MPAGPPFLPPFLSSPVRSLAIAAGIICCAPTLAQTTGPASQGPQHASPAPGSDTKLEFDVVTIKPSDPNLSRGTYFRTEGRHVLAMNVSLSDLISLAYGLHARQIVNGPRWLTTSKFDIDGIPNSEHKPNHEGQRVLFGALLGSRFGLLFHYEQRELPVYALVLDEGGPKFSQTSRLPSDGTTFSYTNAILLTVSNASMPSFADGMQATFLDRPVLDRTGLSGRYDFTLKWTPEETAARETADAPPGLYTAIKEQLGLRLLPVKAGVKAFVIDHVDTPSPN